MDPSPLHYYSRATVLSDMGLHDAAVKGTVPIADSAAIRKSSYRITMMLVRFIFTKLGTLLR
jgi:hypothetical protein